MNVDVSIIEKSSVAQSFRNGKVSIVQLHIFSHQANFHMKPPGFDMPDHLCPFGQIWLWDIQTKHSTDNMRKT